MMQIEPRIELLHLDEFLEDYHELVELNEDTPSDGDAILAMIEGAHHALEVESDEFHMTIMPPDDVDVDEITFGFAVEYSRTKLTIIYLSACD